jgi:hypothetical protein
MKNQHTLGPWTYREAYDNGEPCGYVVQSGVNAIADVPQGEEDARLIAVAPELLDAAKNALTCIEQYVAHEDVDMCAWAEAQSFLEQVIAKAEGAL